jgi:hypothetical protein
MKCPCDLGKCVGCGNTEAWPYTPASPGDKHYPVVYLDGVDDLPCCGTMTIKFHVKEETCRTVDGVETCNVALEIQEILSVKSDGLGVAEVETENPGDRLDAMRSEMEDSD